MSDTSISSSAWPHRRDVVLETGEEPSPAILLGQPEPSAALGLCVFYSGLRSSKEDSLPPGVAGTDRASAAYVGGLLAAGFQVLLVDNPGHGRRKRWDEDPESLLRHGFESGRLDLLDASRRQAPAVVDSILEQGLVRTPAEIAVVGQSWGGLQALLTVAGDLRLTTAVGVIPVCDATALSAFAPFARTATAAALRLRREDLTGRAILLLSGGQDRIAPPVHVEEFARSLIADRTDGVDHADGPASVEHLTLAEVGHTLDPRQVGALVRWLGRHLPALTAS